MSIIINTNGEIQDVEPANKKLFTLEELQKAVGGYIQILQITTGEHAGKLMIVDEEGKFKTDAQVNHEASKIANQIIVGQVIIIDRDQIE